MTDELPADEITTVEDEIVVLSKTDRAAFTALYDRYFPRVARYCLRRLFDRTIAEDVTSEVFLKVVSHLGTFPGRTETDFRRWLFRIATNAVNAHLRQSRRRQELWEAAAHCRSQRAATSPSSPGQPERLDWPTVYQALLELDERDQTIVMLRFFSGFTHEEIADVIDSTPGAVRTALSRTLGRLREKFNSPAPPTVPLMQAPMLPTPVPPDRAPGPSPQG
jgi:RNA polymerase sigma-70 factor, ECF subfamily